MGSQQSKEYILFGNTTLSDIMEEIYANAAKKSIKLESIIHDFNKLIESTEDATFIGPILADYMDISVKNDEHLIKLASLVQKIIAAENKMTENGDILTEKEKKQLRDAAKEQFRKLSVKVDEVGIEPLPDEKLKKLMKRNK